MKFDSTLARALVLTGLSWCAAVSLHAEPSDGLKAIKGYLVTQVTKMNGAAHSYQANAEAYSAIIAANHGDYNAAALASGPQLLSLVAHMQNDYRGIHMNGYETVEGIAAGVKELVYYDIYFDSGVPVTEASTDSPAAEIDLKTASGETIDNRNGNLFHYVIEQVLWGAKSDFVVKLKPDVAKKIGVMVLPRADVVLASAKDGAAKADKFLADSRAWQPTLDECVGALVWMTPTFNGYYNDLKDSLYSPSGKYVSESRVLDMRGIMGSLRLVYDAIKPEIEKKDPALAKQLASEYEGIMAYIDQTDGRDRKTRAAHTKLSEVEIDEMGEQAKTMSDQLAPQLQQVAALLGLKLPPKPFLS